MKVFHVFLFTAVVILWMMTACMQDVNKSPMLVMGATTSQPPPPLILYTDALSGPTSGGEFGLGCYLSIFGRNFGTPSGMGTTTKVFIGGYEVANYRYLGNSTVADKLGIQQLTVQVGSLGGKSNVNVSLPVVVSVNGVSSNNNQKFIPTNGSVLFVALNGSDSTAAYNDINKPWRYLQNMAAYSGAYFAMSKGDHVVIRGGVWIDCNGLNTNWIQGSREPYTRAGTPFEWIHFTAYPGPINGNAIEVVRHSTPAGKSGSIAGPESAVPEMDQHTAEYWSISNLHMDVKAGADQDAAPINFQYSQGPFRVVNNELGPWIAGSSPILNAGGIAGAGYNTKILGNHIMHIEGVNAYQNHGIYADPYSSNWEIAYNWIHDTIGGSSIQFNDAGGYSNTTDRFGTLWIGFVGMNIHHNWLENAKKYGINFSDQQETQTGRYDAKVWNNVIIHTELPPLRIKSSQPQQELWFAYNTLYNCFTAFSGSGNAYVRSEALGSGPGVRNKFYNNIFAFGPSTYSETEYMYDLGSGMGYVGITEASYDFKRNLYFANGLSPPSPSTFGDSLAILASPQFVNAASLNLDILSTSAAVNNGTKALPNGFVVTDDFMNRVRTSPFDIGAFEYVSPNSPPPVTSPVVSPKPGTSTKPISSPTPKPSTKVSPKTSPKTSPKSSRNVARASAGSMTVQICYLVAMIATVMHCLAL